MNTKPTITEALQFAKANRFKAPSLTSRKKLHSYICKNVRYISRHTLAFHIKACLNNIEYKNHTGHRNKLNQTIYSSEIVSDIYNINKFFIEGREIYSSVKALLVKNNLI